MKNLVLSFVSIVAVVFSAASHAVTIDFSDYDGDDAFLNSYTSQGYVFSGLETSCPSLCLWVGDSPPAEDGAALSPGQHVLKVAQVGGGTFGLSSFQFTAGAAGIADYTVVGILESGDQLQQVFSDSFSGIQDPIAMVTVNFSPAWQNLKSFRINVSQGLPIYDNFSLTAVPVPAAVWLFASALGLLGLRRRYNR